MSTSVLNPIISEDLDDILARSLPWETFAGRTVLVTGAAGFLPGYLVETLLRRNDVFGDAPATVVALARRRGSAEKRFAHHAGRIDLRIVTGDVCDPPPTDLRPAVVIHAASQASPRYYRDDPVGTIRPNVVGTDLLLQAARRCGSSHFLFLSSAEVYGEVAPEHNPISEEVPGAVATTARRSCYAEGKRAGEALCVAYYHQFGVPAVIARPFHTYGPGLEADGRVYTDFIDAVAGGRDLVMTGDGSARRAFCYVSDAVAGLFTALLKGEPGTAYNVGNEDAEVGVAELAEMLVRSNPGLRIRRQAPPAGYLPSAVARHCPDTTRLRALGWTPAWELISGFQRAIEGCRL